MEEEYWMKLKVLTGAFKALFKVILQVLNYLFFE